MIDFEMCRCGSHADLIRTDENGVEIERVDVISRDEVRGVLEKWGENIESMPHVAKKMNEEQFRESTNENPEFRKTLAQGFERERNILRARGVPPERLIDPRREGK